MKPIMLTSVLALGLGAGAAIGQDATPFGSDEDAEYATLIWRAMEALHLTGDGMIHTVPYAGVEPHGMMLETFYSMAEIDGHQGDLVVKRNYGPEGVTKDQVEADPSAHLGAVTVMFRREPGFDPDNQDWFWVKYLPDGSLDENPDGMALAGKIAKGADEGCIACHSGETDYLFTTDAITMK